MKRLLLGLCIFSSALFAVDWVQNIDTALQLAKKEHKNVMVMVEGEHCRWCKKMKGRTLTDDAVEKRLQNYVAVKVFREDSTAMAKLPAVQGVPTIFFMRSDKTIIQEVMGYFNVEDFLSYIDDVEKKSN